ncbi:hypothetical protein F0562_009531 [Nyssa sinensis]|uniref:IST1-like protein n=1 Tax=Nyssa sinensis TaxID=561372 RepID=A0A5J4ZZJ4_9ASTE|nr:hypothetical protein F0562_009531 [Nyssa sinensis]
MLDGILGRGFSSKCKSLIKLTRTRINVIQKNKDARQRIMKKDIADLLASGLDINAYGRTEEFFAGLSLLFCYDFIEQSCEYILKQLSTMQKQRECPKECREVVSSLMFAAARFSDLPELRELRDMFQERYGSSLEYFVNQKFVEKLSSKPPTTEKKLQLLQDIGLEFSIKWDSRGFEQRMATPSAFTQDQPAGKYGPHYVTDDKYKLSNGKDTVPEREKSRNSSRKRGELVNDMHGMLQWHGGSSRGKRPELIDGEYKLHNEEVGIVPGRDVRDPPSYGKSEAAASCAGLPVKSEGKGVSCASYNHCGQQSIVSSTRKVQEEGTDKSKSYHSNALPPPYASYNRGGQQKIVSSTRTVLEEGTDNSKSYNSNALPPPYVRLKDNAIPPPYIKAKDSKYGDNIGSKHSSSYCDAASMDTSTHNRENSANTSVGMQIGSDHPKDEGQVVGPAKVKNHGTEKDYHCQG